jgi:putative sterol carrier protein
MQDTPAPSEVRALIDRLRTRDFDRRFQHVQGSYLFDVSGVGRFRVDVDHGRIKVRDDATSGDCVIHSDPQDFMRIARGEQNLITAFMQGRIQLEGDPALAQKLHGLMPAPGAEQGDQPRGTRRSS